MQTTLDLFNEYTARTERGSELAQRMAKTMRGMQDIAARAVSDDVDVLAQEFAIMSARASLYPVAIGECERARVIAHGAYIVQRMAELYRERDAAPSGSAEQVAAVRELQSLDTFVRAYQSAAGQRVTGEPLEADYTKAAAVLATNARESAARSLAGVLATATV